MSRSRRKYAGYCDSNPFMKAYFNRSVRRRNKLPIHVDHEVYNYIPSGRAFKKANCSYDICDWKYVIYSDLEFKDYLSRGYTYDSYKYTMK